MQVSSSLSVRVPYIGEQIGSSKLEIFYHQVRGWALKNLKSQRIKKTNKKLKQTTTPKLTFTHIKKL
jgi:hypothetical protein